MVAKKTTDSEIRPAVRNVRTRTRRKIILNTQLRPKPGARSVPVSHPRKRNALGAERMARSKASIEKDIDSAWGVEGHNQPGEEETNRNRGRMFSAIIVATLMLAVFNSSALVGWVKGLPAGPVEDRIIDTAEVWHGWMEGQGLSRYIDDARTYVASLKDKRWQDLKR